MKNKQAQQLSKSPDVKPKEHDRRWNRQQKFEENTQTERFALSCLRLTQGVLGGHSRDDTYPYEFIHLELNSHVPFLIPALGSIGNVC